MSLFFSLGFINSSILLYPRLQLQATSDFWLSMSNWSVTNHPCLQIQDKIKRLEAKLRTEEHQRKLMQDKTAQVDWKDFILSYFYYWRKLTSLSKIPFLKLHLNSTCSSLGRTPGMIVRPAINSIIESLPGVLHISVKEDSTSFCVNGTVYQPPSCCKWPR